MFRHYTFASTERIKDSHAVHKPTRNALSLFLSVSIKAPKIVSRNFAFSAFYREFSK